MSGAVFYCIFIQGKAQPWAVGNDSLSTVNLVAYDGASITKPADLDKVDVAPDSPRRSIANEGDQAPDNNNNATTDSSQNTGRPSLVE